VTDNEATSLPTPRIVLVSDPSRAAARSPRTTPSPWSTPPTPTTPASRATSNPANAPTRTTTPTSTPREPQEPGELGGKGGGSMFGDALGRRGGAGAGELAEAAPLLLAATQSLRLGRQRSCLHGRTPGLASKGGSTTPTTCVRQFQASQAAAGLMSGGNIQHQRCYATTPSPPMRASSCRIPQGATTRWRTA